MFLTPWQGNPAAGDLSPRQQATGLALFCLSAAALATLAVFVYWEANAQLASGRLGAAAAIGLATLYLFSASLAAGLLYRVWRRQQDAHQALVRRAAMVHESEEKLRGLFEHSPFGMALTDMAGRFLQCNEAFARICGYSAEELQDLRYQSLHAQTDAAADAMRRELLRSGGYGPYETELRRKDGRLVLLRFNGMLMAGADGRSGIWSIVEDITEQRRAEKDASEAHERLTTVLDSLEAIVYVADMATHEVLFANRYTREHIGEVAGRICWQAIQQGQTGPCSFCTNDRLLTAQGEIGKPHVWEFQNTLNKRWYYIIDRAIRWVDGRIVRLEIATDITERKTGEEQLRQFNQALEQRVKERTDELTAANAKLAQQIAERNTAHQELEKEIRERKLAEASTAEFSARLQVMTRRYMGATEAERRRLGRELHDRVSSSLTAVGLSLGLIERQLGRDISASVRQQLASTIALVQETMNAAREVSHNLHPGVLEHGGVLPALEDYGRKFSSHTGIVVELEDENDRSRHPPEVEIALYRIAQEALTNCAKHADASMVRIGLRRCGEATVFTVSDDGAGFDPGTVADEGSSRGLGLLSMRERAEAIGGRLTLESAPGQGTRITVAI